MKDKLLVFQTDFGQEEGTVSQMYGVALQVDPSLRIFEITHEIPAFNIWEASYRLIQTINSWAKETVFVSVIDPGVGTSRKSVVVETKSGHYIVTPNNGTLTHISHKIGITSMREIDETVNRVKGSEDSHTFHGRDVYGYTGAKLAAGKITFEKVGPELPLDEVITFEIREPKISGSRIEGPVEIIDTHFGHVWTNVSVKQFEEAGFSFGDKVEVTISHEGQVKYQQVIPYGKTFSSVPKGAELIYNNELLNMAIGTHVGNFANEHSISAGAGWDLVFEKM